MAFGIIIKSNNWYRMTITDDVAHQLTRYIRYNPTVQIVGCREGSAEELKRERIELFGPTRWTKESNIDIEKLSYRYKFANVTAVNRMKTVDELYNVTISQAELVAYNAIKAVNRGKTPKAISKNVKFEITNPLLITVRDYLEDNIEPGTWLSNELVLEIMADAYRQANINEPVAVEDIKRYYNVQKKHKYVRCQLKAGVLIKSRKARIMDTTTNTNA